MRKKPSRVGITTTLAIIATSLFGCELVKDLGVGPVAEDSTGVASVIPHSASPGTTVRVEADQPVFMRDESVRVEIEGQAATILREISSVAVEVLVPNIDPGGAAVQIVEPDKNAGAAGELTILPPRTLKLLLALAGDDVTLLGKQPQAGHVRRGTDPGGRRMQYEVYNDLGRLVFSNVVNHPTEGRLEIFEEPDSGGRIMRRAEDRAEWFFAVEIPNVPGGAEIRFYSVPEGVDLRTPEGRTERVLVSTMSLEG